MGDHTKGKDRVQKENTRLVTPDEAKIRVEKGQIGTKADRGARLASLRRDTKVRGPKGLVK